MDSCPDQLTLSHLKPEVMYCVISDMQMRASIVVPGRQVQTESRTSRDFRRFGERELESIWPGYVRLHCDGFVLGVWRDPTRPELHLPVGGAAAEDLAPLEMPAVDGDLAIAGTGYSTTGDAGAEACLRRAARGLVADVLRNTLCPAKKFNTAPSASSGPPAC